MKNKYIKRQAFIILASAVVMLGVLTVRRYAETHPLWVTAQFRPAAVAVGDIIARFFGLVRFSAGELLLYAVILGLPIFAVTIILRVVIKRSPPVVLLRPLSLICAATAFFLIVFYGLYGLFYYASPLSHSLGMTVREYSVSELYDTAESLLAELNTLSSSVSRDSDGAAVFGNFSTLTDMAGACYTALAETQPFFAGVNSRRVKPVIASKIMSDFGITGIYWPFTGEANINNDIPDSGLPFTICHELAHSIGICPENEANFTAFLACRASPSVEFQYSGYLSAFIYTYNALYRESPDTARELFGRLSDGALSDIRARGTYWSAHEKKTTVVGTAVNNTYLKVMSQEEGVKSYGGVVDLLISDYLTSTAVTAALAG
jgi:hypothetical protein